MIIIQDKAQNLHSLQTLNTQKMENFLPIMKFMTLHNLENDTFLE